VRFFGGGGADATRFGTYEKYECEGRKKGNVRRKLLAVVYSKGKRLVMARARRGGGGGGKGSRKRHRRGLIGLNEKKQKSFRSLKKRDLRRKMYLV